MSAEILYKGDAKKVFKVKEGDKELWYRFDRVEQYISDIKVGDIVEISYDSVKEGTYTNRYITFIKKLGDSQPTQQASSGAPAQQYRPTGDARQNSIEQQCAVKAAAEIVSAMISSGQLDINMAGAQLETFTEITSGLIKKG